MKKRLSHEEFVDKVAKLQPDIEVLGTYVTANDRVAVRCKKCGREWSPIASSIANTGTGCLHCTSLKRGNALHITTEEFKARMAKASPLVEVIGEYRSSTDKVHVKCLVCGHEWLALPSNLLKTHGCRECMRAKTSTRCKATHDKFVQKLLNAHPEISVAECEGNVYRSSSDHMLFECSQGHRFYAAPHHAVSPIFGCPLCKESRGEQRVRLYLENNGIPFESQKRFEGCANVRKLPFDFYIESIKMAIEFDGEQHYIPIEWFGGKQNLQEVQIRDEIKTKYCLDNGIALVRIPYWDYANIQEILDRAINSRQRGNI